MSEKDVRTILFQETFCSGLQAGRDDVLENVKKKVLALVLGFCCAWQMAWGTVLAVAEKEAGKTGIPALVYDGDPGSDDALALFLLKQNSLVPDLAFATYGNGPEKQMSSNMVLVTGALAMDLPIYQGADRPWKGRKLKFKEPGFNGKDGLLGLASVLKKKSQGRDRKTLQPGDLEEAQKQLKKCRHITYIVTGPLSTLAGLLQDPEVKSRIDRVYLVGGSLTETEPGQAAETNFAQDPKAVKAVMESGLDLTLFPRELTGTQYIGEQEIQNLGRSGKWPEFLELIRANQAAHEKAGEEPAAVLPAIFPILYQLDPSQFAVEDKRITVDKNGQLQEDPQGRLVHGVLGVNPRYQWRAVEKAFSR